MIDVAILRYEESAMRRLSLVLIEICTENFLETADEEEMKESLSPVYIAVEDIVRKAVSLCAADNTISSRLDRPTKPHEFARTNAGCLVNTSIFTVFITRLVQRCAKIVFQNGESSTAKSQSCKENRRGDIVIVLMGRPPALSISFRHGEKN